MPLGTPEVGLAFSGPPTSAFVCTDFCRLSLLFVSLSFVPEGCSARDPGTPIDPMVIKGEEEPSPGQVLWFRDEERKGWEPWGKAERDQKRLPLSFMPSPHSGSIP